MLVGLLSLRLRRELRLVRGIVEALIILAALYAALGHEPLWRRLAAFAPIHTVLACLGYVSRPRATPPPDSS